MLAYIGEKIHDWTDPERLDPWDIVNTVALYFLSGSFASSVMIYNQVCATLLNLRYISTKVYAYNLFAAVVSEVA